jgi:FkbM family methyltransferase
MNGAHNLVHKLIIRLRAEELFVRLRRRASYLRRFIPLNVRHKFTSFGKFVPHSSSYPSDDSHYVIRDNTKFKINRSDYVQWRIFYGVRDNALRSAKECLTVNSIVLDIGANCGAFSLKLAAHAFQQQLSNLTIHAFEPNPSVYKSYEYNLSLNPALQKFIKPHPIGFGSEPGQKAFEFPVTNTGVGRVVQNEIPGHTPVSIQRLDDFVSSLNTPKISFIKLIVEGYEPEVLKGGWNTIKKYKPPIFFEATEEWYVQNNSSVNDVLSQLKQLGYHFQGELHNEMIPYDKLIFDPVYQFNVLATID